MIKMYVRMNEYEGEGGHIYRSLSEIREEISEVRAEIAEINSMLNIRDMLMHLLSDAAEENPAEWMPELCEIVDGAREGLLQLFELELTLSELREELSYTKAALL